MDIGLAFSFVTQDRDWLKKIGIGSLLSLTLIGIIPVLGWGVEVSRRVIHGASEVLPDWSDLGKYIVGGLKFYAITLVWSLPLIVLATCVGGAAGAMAAGDSDSTTLPLILQVCLSLITFPYSLALGVLTPAAAGILANSDSLGEALNPANALKLVRANLGGYLLLFVIVGILATVGGIIGTLLCVVGIFVAAAYITAVNGHLVGQAYLKAKAGN
jgi:Protein of unknown function (DUF4013)